MKINNNLKTNKFKSVVKLLSAFVNLIDTKNQTVCLFDEK